MSPAVVSKRTVKEFETKMTKASAGRAARVVHAARDTKMKYTRAGRTARDTKMSKARAGRAARVAHGARDTKMKYARAERAAHVAHAEINN